MGDNTQPQRPAVLIADDDEVSRFVLGAMLTKRDIPFDAATGGEQAVAMAVQRPFAAIFMDCHMPDVDGYEATRRIRARGASRAAHIIAVSADVSATNQARCRAAGMDDFATKPLRGGQLDVILDRWLGRHARSD